MASTDPLHFLKEYSTEIVNSLAKLKKLVETLKPSQAAVLVYTDNDTYDFRFFHNNEILLEAVRNKLDPAQLRHLFIAERKELGYYLLRPDQPIESMNDKQLKQFTQTMMQQYARFCRRATAGYTDPLLKPSWWPSTANWQNNCIQTASKEAKVAIVQACFRYYQQQCENVDPLYVADDPAESDDSSDDSSLSSGQFDHDSHLNQDHLAEADVSSDTSSSSYGSHSLVSDDPMPSAVAEEDPTSPNVFSESSSSSSGGYSSDDLMSPLASPSETEVDHTRMINHEHDQIPEGEPTLTVLTNMVPHSPEDLPIATEVSYETSNSSDNVNESPEDIILEGETSSGQREFKPLDGRTRQRLAKKLGLTAHKTYRMGKGSNKNGVILLDKPMKTRDIDMDGNCFFRSISYILTGDQGEHMTVRNRIVDHMYKIRNELDGYEGEHLTDEYLSTMRLDGVKWAKSVEIMAAANLLGHDIVSYTKRGNSKTWLTYPASFSIQNLSASALYIDNLNESHYVVVISVL